MFSKIPEIYKNRKVKFIDINIIRPGSRPKLDKLKGLHENILLRGMIYPLLLKDNSSKILLTGNQRLVILKHLGIKKVPVVFLAESFKKYNPPILKFNNFGASSKINFIENKKTISGKERRQIRNAYRKSKGWKI